MLCNCRQDLLLEGTSCVKEEESYLSNYFRSTPESRNCQKCYDEHLNQSLGGSKHTKSHLCRLHWAPIMPVRLGMTALTRPSALIPVAEAPNVPKGELEGANVPPHAMLPKSLPHSLRRLFSGALEHRIRRPLFSPIHSRHVTPSSNLLHLRQRTIG